MEGMTLTFSAAGSPPRKTCVPCRQRKVRCANKQPGIPPCDNCRRLKFDCYFRSRRAAGEAGDGPPLARPEPRRVGKACVRCREHKIRCTGGVPCATCLKKSAPCEYVGPAAEPRRVSALSPPGGGSRVDAPGTTTTTTTQHQQQQSQAESHQASGGLGGTPSTSTPPDVPMLIDAFFKHVYPLPSYGFLHPRTVSRKFADGTIERCLVNAIAAISSVRAPGVRRWQGLESTWVQEAETLIWQHLESPSISRLQAMLLVILYRAGTGQLRRAFMLASLAGRAAMAMRLNHERPGLPGSSLEVRRRLLWSLKLVERYFSVGLPEFELCPVENIYIELPCTEYRFSGGPAAAATAGSSEAEAAGYAWGDADDRDSYHISVKLEMFRRDVMKLNRSLALCDQPFPQLPKLIDDFQQHLDRISSQLPDGPDPSRAQLEASLGGPWLPRHLMMRLSFHQTHIDLYRLLLRSFRDAAPRVVLDGLDSGFLAAAEELCIRHARMTVQTIATLDGVLADDPPRLIEFDTAICAYTASRILLFTARFGSTAERPSEEFALSRAELCLAVVRRFFPRSMLVRPIIEELRRLIGVFAIDGTPAPSRFSSPKPAPSSGDRDPATQLSSAARIRQRLAIHSLLRQAKFVDEEDDELEDGPATGAVEQMATPDTDKANVLPSTETAAAAAAAAPLLHDADYPSMLADSPTATTLPPVLGGQGAAQPPPPPSSDSWAAAGNSPDTLGDNEPWAHWFFDVGADLRQDGLAGLAGAASQGVGLNQRSFTFPWLQREDSDQGPRNVGW